MMAVQPPTIEERGLKRTKLGLKWWCIESMQSIPVGLKRTKLGLKFGSNPCGHAFDPLFEAD